MVQDKKELLHMHKKGGDFMRRQKFVKVMAGVASVCMLSSMITGCGEKKEEATATKTENVSDGQQESNGEGPDELTLFLTNKNIVDDSYAKKKIEEATNTKLTIIQVPTKELDNKLNILLASGERPDIIQCETETMESRCV